MVSSERNLAVTQYKHAEVEVPKSLDLTGTCKETTRYKSTLAGRVTALICHIPRKQTFLEQRTSVKLRVHPSIDCESRKTLFCILSIFWSEQVPNGCTRRIMNTSQFNVQPLAQDKQK